MVSDNRAPSTEKSSIAACYTARARSMSPAKSLRAPLLWTLYVLVPATGWGFLHGVPIELTGAVWLFVIWWTWWYHDAMPGRSMLVLCVLLKLMAAVLSVERGLAADYFANAQWAPPVQRSTQFHTDAFTR